MTQKRTRKTKHELSRETTVALIKQATTDLFVERGYQNCTIEAIARQLGMTKGAVYHYYASKDEIIASILDEIEASIFASIEKAGSLDGASAERRLVVFLNAQASYAMHNPKAFCLLVLCLVSFAGTELVVDKVRDIFDRLETIIREIVAEGAAAAEFSAGIDPVSLARSIVGAYAGNVIAWQRAGFAPEIGRALVTELRQMILARIRS
ncbi:TetR/AcrR family transcriptional regulator [Pararhodobacter sp.]|uniref:TetR/AcrR family transcriptional regulator n=1 Tax=Pararhodobacter sp. TaxID=2127056 RepID=UPI002AFE5A2E|nr:TetR/AcrR family transcriptional regulator [Pararhodobacter sp.]